MLGNLRWRRIAPWALLAAFALGSTGCSRNVPQDGHSGKDYRYKGAKKVKLEEGEGRARDIVTYPGGDRIDWKLVELPEGKKGSLEIKLKWKPPREGLDLAFDVFDEYFERVGRAKPTKGAGKRTKKVKFDGASGKYYVQVYAPERGDAGKYVLSFRFKERKQLAQVDPAALAAEIGDPPTLPAVPEAKPEETPVEAPPVEPVEPVEEVKPVKGRITNVQQSSSGAILTINKGKNAGVDRGWAGTVLRGSSDDPLEGGEFTVIKVTAREAIGKVKLSVDQVKNNRSVLLTPTK